MTRYIYELPDWPDFKWDSAALAEPLAAVRYRQGQLIGRMASLGFDLRREAELTALTQEILKSSEIEGEILDQEQVRSSIARRLGIDIGALPPIDRNVDGVVDMMLDATSNYNAALTTERLLAWHASLFTSARHHIRAGAWRDDIKGPMQVVSGQIGRERVHYQAPPEDLLNNEIGRFLNWINGDSPVDLVLKAAVAHLWFVTIHPFDDGNGGISRTIADMILARSEQTSQRFYSMSAQIRVERKDYYNMLELTQKGTLDITQWIDWFLGCLSRSIDGAESLLDSILIKARFWELRMNESFNDRQRLILNKLLNGFVGKLTSSKWAKICGCSQDTASRDILDLLERGILSKDPAGGRSTSYSLNKP
jgi:Fic family protein